MDIHPLCAAWSLLFVAGVCAGARACALARASDTLTVFVSSSGAAVSGIGVVLPWRLLGPSTYSFLWGSGDPSGWSVLAALLGIPFGVLALVAGFVAETDGLGRGWLIASRVLLAMAWALGMFFLLLHVAYV